MKAFDRIANLLILADSVVAIELGTAKEVMKWPVLPSKTA